MSDIERLIVELEARLNQFEKAMIAAEKRGTKTYNGLQKGAYQATSAIEKQMQASALAQGRALDQIFGQNTERANKSAKGSAAAFREFEKSARAVDSLRAAIDPLYVSTMRYDDAVRDLDQALSLGVISEQQHAAAVLQAKNAYLGTIPVIEGQGGAFAKLSNLSGAARANLQNVGYQVQDMAVQLAGGVSATKALGQQLPQLLGGFGLVGVAVGTLAAVGLPLLGAVFGSTGNAGRDFNSVLGDVENSITAMNEAAAVYTVEGLQALKDKYGEVNGELLAFIHLQTQAAQMDAMQATRDALEALKGETEGFFQTWDAGLAELFGISEDGWGRFQYLMRQATDARTFDAQLAAVADLRAELVRAAGGVDKMTAAQFEFYKKVLNSEDALRRLVVTQPKANWLAAAIGQAETLAAKLWEGVRAKAALADAAAQPGMDSGTPLFEQGFNGMGLPGASMVPQGEKTKTGGGGGGGRGGSSGVIDGLINDLQTEREVVTAWYEESLAAINGATDAQLAAIGGRHEAIERLEREHQARIKGIRDESDSSALANAGTLFGALATITAAGGDRLAKISRATAAAEALINVYRAQAQVLADPKLGFWAKLPAMAAIGAAGMRLVGALGGGGGKVSSATGGAGGNVAAAAVEKPVDPLLLTFKGLDPAALFQGQTIIDMATALQKEFGNRGLKVGFET